mmetsp:Transcript_18052/g.60875  ORF Transcript_18052/g.60875 Transcript_18052/m.60875 type:complete len:366 (-) Transcript_18052:603-1700(-)
MAWPKSSPDFKTFSSADLSAETPPHDACRWTSQPRGASAHQSALAVEGEQLRPNVCAHSKASLDLCGASLRRTVASTLSASPACTPADWSDRSLDHSTQSRRSEASTALSSAPTRRQYASTLAAEPRILAGASSAARHFRACARSFLASFQLSNSFLATCFRSSAAAFKAPTYLRFSSSRAVPASKLVGCTNPDCSSCSLEASMSAPPARLSECTTLMPAPRIMSTVVVVFEWKRGRIGAAPEAAMVKRGAGGGAVRAADCDMRIARAFFSLTKPACIRFASSTLSSSLRLSDCRLKSKSSSTQDASLATPSNLNPEATSTSRSSASTRPRPRFSAAARNMPSCTRTSRRASRQCRWHSFEKRPF